jgi:hypothetical protein
MAKKKSAKKKAAKKKRAVRPTSSALSRAERQTLAKPHSNYGALADQFLSAWTELPQLRVPKLSPPKLRSLLAKATRASDKRTKTERVLREQADAELVAEDALWRALMDGNFAVKGLARSEPAVLERFAFLTNAFRGGRKKTPSP